MKTLTSFPLSIVSKTSSFYNKAFHSKIFTLFASSESEVYTLASQVKPHYDSCYAFMEAEQGQWFLDINGIERIRKWVLRGARSGVRHVTRQYRSWQKYWNRYLVHANRLLVKDLSRLSDQKLIQDFSSFYEKYLQVGSVAYLADSFMSTGAEDWLETLLKKELKRLKISQDAVETVRLLTSPVHLSFALKEEHYLLRLAVRFVKQYGFILPPLKELKTQSPTLYQALKKHEQQFYWIRNNYYHVEYVDLTDIYTRIKRLLKRAERRGIIISQMYQTKEQELRDFKTKRQQLVASLALSRYHKNVLIIAWLFSKWKDVRKSGVYIGMYHFDRFLSEIASRARRSKKDLTFLVFDEIRNIFSKKENLLERIKERKQRAFFAVTPHGYYIIGGKAAAPYFKYFMRGQSTEGKELRGVVASPGKVKGRVRVINTNLDMKLFKRGEILVANQTTPEFVTIMKKAAAIVTEQGGITSHAAIVARELHKPCIIGTKIATRVLKDGDRVEVDANQGVVKKLD